MKFPKMIQVFVKIPFGYIIIGNVTTDGGFLGGNNDNEIVFKSHNYV